VRRRGGSGRCVQTRGAADDPGLERLGAMQAAGDAGEDQCHLGGAEAGGDEVGLGEGTPPDRGGELAAVLDELADEAEEAATTAGFGGRERSAGRVGHERNQNMRERRM
jgi:hypothetical protein